MEYSLPTHWVDSAILRQLFANSMRYKCELFKKKKTAWGLDSNTFMSTVSGEHHHCDSNNQDFLVGEEGGREFYFSIYVSEYEV